MHSKMDEPKKSKRLIIWNGWSISQKKKKLMIYPLLSMSINLLIGNAHKL